MATEYLIGSHRYIIDDDLVHNIPDPNRSLDLEMMQAYTALLEPVFVKFGRVFLLTDGGSIFSVTAQARRHLADWSRGAQIVASATYGGNYVSRTLIKMIVSVMSLSGRNRGRMSANQAFFASEAAARSWLLIEREKYLAAHPGAAR